jgi:hypothetical protein
MIEMSRISGMVLALGLLVVLSSIASPASAWDSDDDDDYKPRYNLNHYPYRGDVAPIVVAPVVREPIFVPPQPFGHYDNAPNPYEYAPRPYLQYQSPPDSPPVPVDESIPRYQSNPHIPLAPPPLPPEQLFGDVPPAPITGPSFASTEPELVVTPQSQAGEFVTVETPLYPHVRVKGREEIPRHAVPRIVAVRSPDPFRFPGLVYVQVYVPPGRCAVKVEQGGAKVEMKSDDFEVKIVSSRGIVSVEYDD